MSTITNTKQLKITQRTNFKVQITIDGTKKRMSLVGAAQKLSERDPEDRTLAFWEQTILAAFSDGVAAGINGIHVQPI